jgi:YtkA-like
MMSMARPSTPLTLLIAAACAACSSGSPSAAAFDTGPVPASDAPSGEVGCTNQAGLDTYAGGIKKLGAAGRFEFELVSSTPAPPALDNNTFVVRVTAAGGDQPLNGELSVALDMPEHGHPSPKSPTITFDPDAKVYTLDPMDLFMVGLWQITFSFASLFAEENGAGGSAGEGDTPSSSPADSAVFKFCIE